MPVNLSNVDDQLLNVALHLYMAMNDETQDAEAREHLAWAYRYTHRALHSIRQATKRSPLLGNECVILLGAGEGSPR